MRVVQCRSVPPVARCPGHRGRRPRQSPHHEHGDRREAEDEAGEGQDGRQFPADSRREHLQGSLVGGAELRKRPFGLDDGDVGGLAIAT